MIRPAGQCWAAAWPVALVSALVPSLARAAEPPPAASAPAEAAAAVSEVVVTARRLDAARSRIQPQLGASVYTIGQTALTALPGGDNVSLSQVILQAPGVVQDSDGQLHVRGEHNGLQYRLNGVILPEGLSVFGQALNPRLADKVALITGALPAQYGLRTAGIIDITTRQGTASGGSASVYGGGQGLFQPSLEASGGSGGASLFVSGQYLRSDLGLSSPDGSSSPIHNFTQQWQAFAYGQDSLSPDDRISAILGVSVQKFQIPNIPGQVPSLMFGPNGDEPLVVDGRTTFPSADLNENQQEVSDYGVVSWLHDAGALTAQISIFGRYSSLTFTPDPLGDLLFNGIATDAFKRDVAGGVQAEAAWRAGEAHTVRGGVIVEVDRATSRTASQVIALDPKTHSQLSDQPVTIAEQSAATAVIATAYLQDEWRLAPALTLNYGLRFDQYDGYRNEYQLSPRINAVWTPTPTSTVHAGYARYFSPPPFELVGQKTVAKFVDTTGAAPSLEDTTPWSERANYFDVGLSQTVTRGLTVAVDSYFKSSVNLIDEGQFGAPIILTPFNYAQGRQYGLEANATLQRGPWSAYANFAYEHNQGREIVSSQFNFTPEDLAYIAGHYIFLDHNQSYTASAGATYTAHKTTLGADLIYGSGLRSTGADGVPNGEHVPGYVQVNLSVSHRFSPAGFGDVVARLDLINAFGAVYVIRNGTGVGAGAPQYGPPRGLFAGLTKEF